MELTVNQMLQQGVAAHNTGNLQEAERLYRAILQSQTAHPDANHNLGLIAVSMNQSAAALPLFKLALETNPKMEQFWLSYIDALIKEKQFENAKQVLEQGKKQGVAGEKLNALESQLASINQTENVDSASPSPQQLSSLLEYYQNGRYGDAEKLALSVTQEFPNHQFGWKVLGAVLKQTGRISESLVPSQKSVQLVPQDAEAHNNLGTTLQELGRLEEAEESYRQAIAITPDYAEAYNNLGATLQELGKLEEAESSYKKSIELKYDYTEAHYNMGITLNKLGKLDEAEVSYRQAIALKSDHAEAHCNLGTILKERGRLEEAEVSYRQAIALKSDFSEAHYNLGNTLNKLGKLDEAEVSYRQAIALKSDHAEAHCNLGTMLKEQGRLEEAEESYRQAISLKSDFTFAHNNLGNALQELGRLEEAEESYRQAIALKPDYAEAHNNLGNALQELGRLEEAVGSFRQAIALKPDYAEAHYNLGVLLFETKQYDMAAELFGLVDIHKSKSYGIRCSYLQDEETVFYEKLKALIDQGECDAVIGSLSCSAEIRYGVRKPNPFCNDPLKYVVKTDLNERYDFENIFAKTARDILTDKSVSYKTQGLLTKGIQTAGNFFAMKKVFITEIESIIRAEIEKYRINFEDSEEGFIKNWPTSYDISGWLVRMQSGGELAAHMHDTGWLSGSIYINVPPKSKTDSGNLVVCVGDQKNVLGADKNQESIIDVVTGNLCFFPSSLHHYTVPFEEEENRIVLAFDVLPKK
jgi:Flp pilus assembly protein TadD